MPPVRCRPVLPALASMLLASSTPAADPPLAENELPRLPALPAPAALASLKVAPGYQVELAAAEPEITDPIALCFDDEGALYVVEMGDYSERRAERLSRVKRLTDADGDGRFETSSLFLDGLAWATGITCWKEGILVAATPDIIYARDTNGDGRADEQRVVLSGFGAGRPSLNVQALVNSLTFGPDNRIWGATAGNGGTVAGVPLDGADFSFDPNTFALQAETGTAQYGLTFDAGGRRFVCSNSRHLQWVALERPYTSNPLARIASPLVDIPVDGPAAPVFRLSPEEPWRVVRTRWRASGTLPGIIEGGGRASGYFTSASGLCVYTGDLLPALSGQVFVGDVGSNLVHRKHLRETPEGPVAERDPAETNSEFLASPDTWFRPVACANGPDGALYVIDMYREVIEHPDSLPPLLKSRLDLNSGHDRGRLYRIVPEDSTPRRHTNLRPLDGPALAALTSHPNGWHRITARRLLVERQDPAAAATLRQTASPDALTTLDGLGLLTVYDLDRALAAPDPDLVVTALRLLEKHPDDSSRLAAALAALTGHPSPAVRRQWALTLGRLALPDQTNHLAGLWNHPAGGPRLREAVRLSLRSGRQTLSLLRSLPAPDTELVAMIGRSRDAEAIAGTARWLQDKLSGNPALLFSTLTSLDDLPVLERFAESASLRLADPAAALDVRLAAAALLVRLASPTATPILESIFFDEKTPEPVRLAAWPAIDQSLAERVWTVWPQLSATARQQVLERAVARSAWHQPLLGAIAAGQLGPLELTADQANQLRQSTDPAVRDLALSTLGPAPPNRQDVIASRWAALTLPGEAAVGATIFRQRCLTCHRDGNEGVDLGPARETFRHLGKPTLLLHLLDPNREVAPRYLAASVITTGGDTWQGLLLQDEVAALTLRLVGGRTLTIERSEIARFERLTRSLMPEGLETGLTDSELASLLEFLIQ